MITKALVWCDGCGHLEEWHLDPTELLWFTWFDGDRWTTLREIHCQTMKSRLKEKEVTVLYAFHS